MIDIIVTIDGCALMQCSYIFLEPYAPTTSRKFTFENVVWQKKDTVSLYGEEIKVSINVRTKSEQWKPISEFRIYVLDYQDLNENLCWVSGLVYNDYNEEYRQGIIDIFNVWKSNKEFDWFSLPVHSPLKQDYISACLVYSGVSNEIIKRDCYNFDMALVKEKKDFFYLAGIEFVGVKGYFGHNLHSFNDCLLTVFHQRGFFYDTNILFLNINDIANELSSFYEEIKEVLLRFKFTVDQK